MRRFVLLVALVLAIGIVPIAGATSALSIGTPGYDSSVVKGNSFSVTASITASGVGGSGISVTATLQDNTGGAVTITSAEQVKAYDSNTSKTFTWTVTANTPGTYAAPFTVSASANDGGTGSPAAGTTALTIKDRPVLELTLSKNATMVEAGDSVRLNYTVTNSGSGDAADATDVNVSLILPDGWNLSAGTIPYDLGTMAPSANSAGYWIVTADSPNATNTLTVTVTSTIPGGTVAGAYAFGETTIPGDVTGNGVVNIGDAVLLFNWVSFMNERKTTYALTEAGNADVTGDGMVGIGDAVLLFNWVSFPNDRGTTYVLQ